MPLNVYNVLEFRLIAPYRLQQQKLNNSKTNPLINDYLKITVTLTDTSIPITLALRTRSLRPLPNSSLGLENATLEIGTIHEGADKKNRPRT